MILDACCGGQKIYNGFADSIIKDGSLVSIDIRKGTFVAKREKGWCDNVVKVKPTIIADIKFLPFKDEVFSSIVFDPPHVKCGKTSILYAYYGSWDQTDAIRALRLVDPEFNRVLEEKGFLFLKIMCDRKNIYLELLRHFKFFLPIQLKRPRGSFKNPKPDADGALWLIGLKKLVTQPELEVMPQITVFNSEKKKK